MDKVLSGDKKVGKEEHYGAEEAFRKVFASRVDAPACCHHHSADNHHVRNDLYEDMGVERVSENE